MPKEISRPAQERNKKKYKKAGEIVKKIFKK